jgi:curli biogenesis system outer membrane secretion channel CsgG
MSRFQPHLVLVFILSFAFAAAAEDAKYVKIVNVNTGKVLAVTDDSDDAGARAVLAKDEPNQARQWQLVKDGNQLKIVNRKTGKVLDVNEASKDEDAEVIQWDEKTDDNDNQRWSWDGAGEERRLKAKHSGLVLDANADGKVIQKKADEKSKSQLWRAVEVKD